MTTEDAFWQTLEADPTDRVTRLIFSDWLDQEGRAAEANGQRWQVRNRQWPHWSTATGGSWDWWSPAQPSIPDEELADGFFEATLPLDVFWRLEDWTWNGWYYREYPTLRAAETALAQALYALEL